MSVSQFRFHDAPPFTLLYLLACPSLSLTLQPGLSTEVLLAPVWWIKSKSQINMSSVDRESFQSSSHKYTSLRREESSNQENCGEEVPADVSASTRSTIQSIMESWREVAGGSRKPINPLSHWFFKWYKRLLVEESFVDPEVEIMIKVYGKPLKKIRYHRMFRIGLLLLYIIL